MHELSIAKEIINTLNGLKKEYENKNIIKVVVQIGEMSAILPDSLEYNFNIVKEDTTFSNAKLELEIVPLKFKCNKCNEIFGFSENEFCCPKCNIIDYQITQGAELQIKEIEVE